MSRKRKADVAEIDVSAQIEVIPCKVCNDKSSGVHYGVITCEGCKGFFRRSTHSEVNYHCPRERNCQVDRLNRNRCQYCRLQKCLALGMSRDAVKFGRMSKKQRAKVEQEVFHYQQTTAGELPFGGLPQASMSNYIPQGAFVPEQPSLPTFDLPSHPSPPVYVKSEPQEEVTDIAKAVLTAYHSSSLYAGQSKPDVHSNALELLGKYDHLSRGDWWSDCSNRLTSLIQQIIEFAKLIPGFMHLSQDDQIMLLKGGVFEACLVWMAQLYDPLSRRVMYGGEFLPIVLFDKVATGREGLFLRSFFSAVAELNSYGLNDQEIALLSAAVLVCPDRPGLQDNAYVNSMRDAILNALDHCRTDPRSPALPTPPHSAGQSGSPVLSPSHDHYHTVKQGGHDHTPTTTFGQLTCEPSVATGNFGLAGAGTSEAGNFGEPSPASILKNAVLSQAFANGFTVSLPQNSTDSTQLSGQKLSGFLLTMMPKLNAVAQDHVAVLAAYLKEPNGMPLPPLYKELFANE